jgi:glycosyltransferase involved in cell wall biosynthesis
MNFGINSKFIINSISNNKDFIKEQHLIAISIKDITICKKLKRKDKLIGKVAKLIGNESEVVYVNDKNAGQFPNRNIAASYAKGKYLKYLDSDDTIEAYGLAYCVDQMERFPNAGLGMYFSYPTTDKDGECWDSETIIREHFFKRSILSIGPTGTIINREQFEKTGRFDTRFGVPSDMYFNIRFASMSPIVLLPKLFINYRTHDQQEINNRMDYLVFGYLYFKEILEKVKLPLSEKEIKYLHAKMENKKRLNDEKLHYPIRY